jgi:sec-independent protein translocase protein TatA
MVVGMLEGPDGIIVLAIALVMFGAKRLPELARSLGQARREFEAAVNDTAPAPMPTPDPKPLASDSITLTNSEYQRLLGASEFCVVQQRRRPGAFPGRKHLVDGR